MQKMMRSRSEDGQKWEMTRFSKLFQEGGA